MAAEDACIHVRAATEAWEEKLVVEALERKAAAAATKLVAPPSVDSNTQYEIVVIANVHA